MNKLLSSETTNYQLMELAKKLGLHINNIVYVDQLRYIPAKQGNYIINLRKPTHWTGLYIDGKKAFYFNSYASIMSIPKEVIQFMKRCKCTMYYDSDKSVQLSSQGHCGQFTIDFLCYMNFAAKQQRAADSLQPNKSGNPVINYERFLSHLHSTNKENLKYVIRQLL